MMSQMQSGAAQMDQIPAVFENKAAQNLSFLPSNGNNSNNNGAFFMNN